MFDYVGNMSTGHEHDKIYRESIFGFRVTSLPIFQQTEEIEQFCIAEHYQKLTKSRPFHNLHGHLNLLTEITKMHCTSKPTRQLSRRFAYCQ